MHFSLVLEHLDSFCHWRLVAYNCPSLFKVPTIHKTITAKVTFSCSVFKWFAARGTEWFPQQPDILQAYPEVRNIMPAFESSAAPQAGHGEKNIQKGRPEFCSENIAHFVQNFHTHINIFCSAALGFFYLHGPVGILKMSPGSWEGFSAYGFPYGARYDSENEKQPAARKGGSI